MEEHLDLKPVPTVCSLWIKITSVKKNSIHRFLHKGKKKKKTCQHTDTDKNATFRPVIINILKYDVNVHL